MRTKEEFRKLVAEQFLHVLEEKPKVWIKEWHCRSIPMNAVTENEYRGVNQFYLQIVSMIHGYTDPRWMTFNQVKKNYPGARVKAGEHASDIEYWFVNDLTKAQGEKDKYISFPQARKLLNSGQRAPNELRPVARYFKVFNAEQIDNIPQWTVEEQTNEIEQAELVTTLSEKMGVPIINDGGDNAFYNPLDDEIHLPRKEIFDTEYAYNATALHELAHSTGHSSRLNRPILNAFGSDDYAQEELIAEMTSCFLAVETLPPEMTEGTNMQTYTENHKAYVQNWAVQIREKPDLLVFAVKKAEQAADYMHMKAGIMTVMEYEMRYKKDALDMPAAVLQNTLQQESAVRRKSSHRMKMG